MKKINKHKKEQRGKTPAKPRDVIELTEHDLEQVQGGQGRKAGGEQDLFFYK